MKIHGNPWDFMEIHGKGKNAISTHSIRDKEDPKVLNDEKSCRYFNHDFEFLTTVGRAISKETCEVVESVARNV